MKKHLIIWMAVLAGCFSWSVAQQVPISLYQIMTPRPFNPANGGAWHDHNLLLLHQQRGAESAGSGWGNISDFFNYSSAPIFKSRRFGWGVMVATDHIHTDTRIGLTPSISAVPVLTKHLRWGLGVYGGFSHWRYSLQGVPIFQDGDPVLSANYNFTELDAGCGTDIALKYDKFTADCGAYFTQLPANAVSAKLEYNRLVPHIIAYGGASVEPVYNLLIGPRIFYRNGMFGDTSALGGATMDIGIKADFVRQKMWAAAAWRVNNAGWTAGFGMRMMDRDTTKHPGSVTLGINLIAMFRIPGRESVALGPSGEIGLGFVFGPRRIYTRYDTLRDQGPIWESNANLTRHKDLRLAPGCPPGIVSELIQQDSFITIGYQFPDDSRNFAGDKPVYARDSLLEEIGMEWVGVDNLLENVFSETVEECLSPDLSHVLDPSRMDSLKRLKWIQLSTNLKWDLQSATSGPGITYEGQLNPPGHKQDTLIFPVVYDERDTIVKIPPRGYYLNNFELAALKLYAMRLKLQHELVNYYAARNRHVRIFREEERAQIVLDVEKEEVSSESMIVVFIRKLRIESDHPKQKPLQLNLITLKFRRYMENEDRYREYDPVHNGPVGVPGVNGEESGNGGEPVMTPGDWKKHRQAEPSKKRRPRDPAPAPAHRTEDGPNH